MARATETESSWTDYAPIADWLPAHLEEPALYPTIGLGVDAFESGKR